MRNIFNSEKEFAKKNIPVKFNHGGELNKGIEIEMEHAKTLKNLFKHKINPNKAVEEIAKEHIKEDPSYYSKLNKMEHKFAGGGNIDIGQRGEYGRKKILGTIKKISPKIVTFTEEASGKDKTYYIDDFKKGFVLLSGSSSSTTTTPSSPKTISKKPIVTFKTSNNGIKILEQNDPGVNGFIALTNGNKQNAFEFLATVIQRMGYVRDNGSTDILSDTDSAGFYCFKRVSDDKLIVEPLTQSKVNNASTIPQFDIANMFYWEQQKSLLYVPDTDKVIMREILEIGDRELTQYDFKILPIGTKIALPEIKNGNKHNAINRYNYVKENLNDNKDFDFFYYQGPYQGFYEDVMLSFNNTSGGDLYTVEKDKLKLYIDDSQAGIDKQTTSKPLSYDELKALGKGAKIRIPANNGNISYGIIQRADAVRDTKKVWAEAIEVNESEIEWAEIVEIDDSDRTIKIDRFDGNKNPISYMYIWPDNVNVYLYNKTEIPQEEQANSKLLPLSNVLSTDPSTWDASFNVGDIVSIRPDFCDPKYEVDFDYNSKANLGVIKKVRVISEAKRKENPNGEIYDVHFTGGITQSWEPKDLELRRKGDKTSTTKTSVDTTSSKKSKKDKKESKKTNIKKANNIEEAINNWIRNNSVNLVKKEWGEDAKNMLLEFIK